MNDVDQKAVLTVSDVVAGYRADLPILHGVGLQVQQGEIITVIGPNGAGKSTLIKAVAGLVPISAGRVEFQQQEITHTPAHQLAARGIGFVPQTGNIFTTLSIQENLVMGGMGLSARLAAQRIEEIYALYPMLAERRREKAGILSGGQRQMLAVARALLTQPRLIMLDEPTAGLSPKAATELFSVIKNLVSEGASVLMVEQNAKAALRISDRAYVLAEGENRIHGAAQQLLQDANIGEIFLGGKRTDDSIKQDLH